MKALLTFALLTHLWLVADAQTNTNQPPTGSYSKYQAGIHFNVINPAWDNADPGPIVYEFFSYMCPGCNAFEPVMDQLKEQSTGKVDVNNSYRIIKVPVALYPQWEPHAKAYYTLEMMGELDRVHKAFFAAIHQYKKQFRTIEDIALWMSSSFGIDQKTFLGNANSFMIDGKMRKGKQMIKAMGVNRLPTLVVGGQYKPNFDQMKTHEDILAVTAYLVGLND